MNTKELIEPIDKFWKRELLESLFGDEQISELTWSNPCSSDEVEYELECVLRRKAIVTKK